MSRAPFHLAFPVTDLDATKQFFVTTLGCGAGREAEGRWVDFDFHGHQISAHRVERMPAMPTNRVDGCDVPVSHFGLVLDWDDWTVLRDRLEADEAVRFLIRPYIRFAGKRGEQGTMFILDPSGNGLEFKAFRNPEEMFA